MKAAGWMVAVSLGSWAALAGLLDRGTRLAVLAGLVGPLVVAAASWVAIERTHRQKPAAMTSVMVAAFGAKVVFVGVYVSVMLGLFAMPGTPFVISFTSYFIALYVVEAFLLRRLLGTGAR